MLAIVPRKLLILEGEWQHAQAHSSGHLYARVCAGQALQAPLRLDWAQTARAFTALAENRRGVNCIIISTHASSEAFATLDGSALLTTLAASVDLRRTLLLLDSCHAGARAAELRATSGALAVIGFATEVDWLASSVFILALLRYWHRSGVFTLRRCSATRPRQGFAALAHGSYQQMMTKLQVRACFKGD
jgi:hypothetical protein